MHLEFYPIRLMLFHAHHHRRSHAVVMLVGYLMGSRFKWGVDQAMDTLTTAQAHHRTLLTQLQVPITVALLRPQLCCHIFVIINERYRLDRALCFDFACERNASLFRHVTYRCLRP